MENSDNNGKLDVGDEIDLQPLIVIEEINEVNEVNEMTQREEREQRKEITKEITKLEGEDDKIKTLKKEINRLTEGWTPEEITEESNEKLNPPIATADPVMRDRYNDSDNTGGSDDSNNNYSEKTPLLHNHQLDKILSPQNVIDDAINMMDQERITNDERINDWNDQNTKTVKRWQLDIEKTSFVYGEIVTGVTLTMQRLLVSVLIINSLMTMFSALSITLAFLDIKFISVGFSIANGIGAVTVTIMLGIIKLYGMENLIRTFTKFIENLDNTWFAIETELNIGPDQRLNAKDFIKRYDGEYMHLMRQSPPISGEEYSNANRKYKERLFDDHMWSLKFKNKVKTELNELNELRIKIE